MSQMQQKVKLSAVQPEGDRNGLTQPEVMTRLTEGFSREARHLAIVELEVVDQTQNVDGVLTNRVHITRIELVEGESHDAAFELLQDAAKSRQHDTLPGMGDETGVDDENVGGRGNE